MKYDAIIFDCDGTLADTMPLHYEAWAEALGQCGETLDEDVFYSLGGVPTLKIAELLVRERNLSFPAHELGHAKEAAFLRRLAHCQPVEPVVAVVKAEHGKCPLAVASGGTRDIILDILQRIGLADCFDLIVTCEDVTQHKPDPAIFLTVAKRLGVDPTKCLVYEDADPGIEAARRAGMAVRDVRTFFTPRRVTPRHS